MTIIDTNEQSFRTRTFKGFVQMQDPDNTANYLRFKERQTLNVTFRFGREGHYSDFGRKVLDPTGQNHTFDMRVKFTNDLVSTTDNPPTDQSSISQWIYQNTLFNPVELVFVTTLESINEVIGAAGDKFGHFKFILNPDTFGPLTFGASGGTNDFSVSGEVIEIITVKRATTSTAPTDPSTPWRPTS